jgi:hypothetical protein
VLVVVALVGYLAVAYTVRSHPGAKSVHAAVREFRPGPATAAADTRYQEPAQGVYQLTGQGTERISFPPNSQHDGSPMPATVTSLPDDCWRWHVAYNVAHWEEYDFCPQGATMVERANRNSQSWDFGTLKVSNVADFTCPSNATVLPADTTAGQRVSWACTGTNSSVPGGTTSKVVSLNDGVVTLTVGHATVQAVHELETTTLSGSQRGTVVENWWFSATTGLPLRVDRDITVKTDSPLGAITYGETGSWKMVSLTPRS